MVKAKARNPLKIDPSRTTMLRRAFITALNKIFRDLNRKIKELVVTDDAFGLEGGTALGFESNSTVTMNAERQIWRFQTDVEKTRSFRRWLQRQIKLGLMKVDATGKPWSAKYIESAYKRGAMRAYVQARPETMGETVDFYRGKRSQFLESSFQAPEAVSKVQLLTLRTFDELEGISGAMSQKISRVLSSGMVDGKGPRELAREMFKEVNGISRARARTIARTEIIHAHAEGQLDSFEQLGVEGVSPMAEWLTAGDNEVCDECEPLQGVVMTIEEARGLLPRHPNCRCAWIPAGVGEDGKGQKTGKREKQTAFRKSMKGEFTKRQTVKEASRRSTWAGKKRVADLSTV